MPGVDQIGTRTVLFTDLVGSTELRVRLGEERADEFRRAHDALISQALTTNGGEIVKGLGDGVMATFSSAADAVAAAVALQQSVEAHGRREPAEAFALRIGVSSGDVSAEAGDVFGVPVVEASRLCGAANGGEILIAELVRALARGRGGFVFEPMGELTLKGLPDPLAACRVNWEPLIEPDSGETAIEMPAELLGAATAYVGREELRDLLGAEWAAVRSGACRTLLLAGEPGVGKTRTAAELARLAGADGGIVLYGRCDEDLGVPYQPFVEALEHYLAHASHPHLGRLPGELARLVPDVSVRVAGVPAPLDSDPASEEYRLFEATASWLNDMATASGSGVVLVLDDIHWATKPTLQLLLHIARSATTHHAPLLIVATYRDTDVDRTHPLSSLLSDLRRLDGVSRIAVDNLSAREVIEMIETAAGHELDADTLRLADAIHAETDGNPFFIAEVLRHLIESGGVRREGDRWYVSDPDNVTVPEGVRDVVGRRLNRLSAASNEVLTVGAVIGRDFDIDLVMTLVDHAEDATLDALDEAVRARLVEEVGTDLYRFAHALVRTTLFDELSATRRRRLHRRIADALEKLRPHDVRALAYHCTEAGPDGGELTRALKYSLAAAEEALAARAFAEAETRFRSVLELAEETDDAARQAIAAMCGLGESQRDQGKLLEFRETLLGASRRAIAIGDRALATRAVLANTRGYVSIVSGLDLERIALIEEALALLEPGVSAARAELTALLASELTFSGDNPRRRELAGAAEAMARDLGDERLLCRVLVLTEFASFHAAHLDEWCERAREMTARADALGDLALAGTSRLFLAAALYSLGRLADAEGITQEMVELSKRDLTPSLAWSIEYHTIRQLYHTGDLAALESRNDEMVEMGTALGQPDAVQWWSAIAISAAWLRGTMAPFVDGAREYAEAFPHDPGWKCVVAWALAEAGRADEAHDVIRNDIADPTRVFDSPWPLHTVAILAMSSLHFDDPDYATRLVEIFRPRRSAFIHSYIILFAPATWPLACALSGAGQHDEAVATMEDAVTYLDAHGFRAHLPRARLDLARILVRRGATGDRERAIPVLSSARDGAAAYQSPGLVATIDELRSELDRKT